MKATLFITLAFLIASFSWSETKNATVKEAKGGSYIIRDFKRFFINNGAQLQSRDQLNTDKGTLLLKDPNISIFLSPHSQMHWMDGSIREKLTHFTLAKGNIRITSHKEIPVQDYRIKTPTTQISPSNADFIVQVLQEDTLITVITGMVEITPLLEQKRLGRKSITLNSGQQTRIKRWQPPSRPKNIDPYELELVKLLGRQKSNPKLAANVIQNQRRLFENHIHRNEIFKRIEEAQKMTLNELNMKLFESLSKEEGLIFSAPPAPTPTPPI